jgi:hypothetical protein
MHITRTSFFVTILEARETHVRIRTAGCAYISAVAAETFMEKTM